MSHYECQMCRVSLKEGTLTNYEDKLYPIIDNTGAIWGFSLWNYGAFGDDPVYCTTCYKAFLRGLMNETS